MKGGRRFTFTALVVLGDQKGQVGWGYGKATEVPQAVEKAVKQTNRHTAKVHLMGTADSLADLLMREPLRKQAGLALDPATVKGQAEGDLVLDLKLGRTAHPEDTQFRATGALDNLQIEKFLADEKLEGATASFEADRNQLKIVGDGQLLGAATHVEVSRALGEEGAATSISRVPFQRSVVIVQPELNSASHQSAMKTGAIAP